MLHVGNFNGQPALLTFFPFEIRHLFHSEIEFHLTGSRYFGGVKEGSDWDFFTQDCQDTREFLLASRYEVEDTEFYIGDPNLKQVWRLDNNHVEFVKDLDKKIRAQQIIKAQFGFYFPDMNKIIRRKVWRAVSEAMEYASTV